MTAVSEDAFVIVGEASETCFGNKAFYFKKCNIFRHQYQALLHLLKVITLIQSMGVVTDYKPVSKIHGIPSIFDTGVVFRNGSHIYLKRWFR